MEVTATYKLARISPQKARLVMNEIRGMAVSNALDRLEHTPKKAAGFIRQTLFSAIANAEHNHGLDIDELFVSSCYVNEGARVKRFRARAKGRGARIIKRMCHITVKVSEKEGS